MATLLKILYKYPILNLSYVCQHHAHVRGEYIVKNTYKWQSIVYYHSSNTLFPRKRDEIAKKLQEREYISPKKRKSVCDVWEGMTVQELGKSMGKDADYIFNLMYYVENTTKYKRPTDILEWVTLTDLLKKANMRPRNIRKSSKKHKEEDQDVYPRPPADDNELKPRPPVVTIMGHVDHGKTTLLDYLRKSSIVASEFGGITQHIGAFSVKLQSNSVTFLDTPGHAAFKSMRSRGAHCTDIVVLVVAADDGVMEQTEESIRMAREANVPIIVAINKIDKRDANVKLTKQMLMTQGLIPEDSGGDIQCVPISALKGTNVDALVEAIIVEAEINNLRSDPQGKVEGVVIESRLDPYQGKATTTLIRRGTVKKNCFLAAGLSWCKVKQMYDEHGNVMKEAPPSTPVVVLGWRDLPTPGDIILEVESEKRARQVVEYRTKKYFEEKTKKEMEVVEVQRRKHEEAHKERMKVKLAAGHRMYKRTGIKEKESKVTWTGPLLCVIIKSDVEGSLEALLDVLYTYYDPRCKLDIVHSGIGHVTVGDIEIAQVFNAVVYSFNVDVLPNASEVAVKNNISIRPFNIIYRFAEDVKREINNRLPMLEKEKVTGEAVVQQLFLITEGKQKNIPVAGCLCTSGELKKNATYKLLRNGVEIFRGQLVSMRNLKTETTSIGKDQECGLRFNDNSIIFEEGDIVQSYTTYKVSQEIGWSPF